MAYKYDLREGTHGNEKVFYAEIKYDAVGGTYSFGEVKPFTGAISLSVESEQESNKFYADNQVHLTINGKKQISGELTVYQIPKSFMTNHLGYATDTNGALTDTGLFKSFALGYIELVTDETGAETEQLRLYYNVTASAPQAESTTDEDAIELKEFTIPLTMSQSQFVKDAEGKPISELILRKTTTNATVFDKVFDTVYLPNSQ